MGKPRVTISIVIKPGRNLVLMLVRLQKQVQRYSLRNIVEKELLLQNLMNTYQAAGIQYLFKGAKLSV